MAKRKLLLADDSVTVQKVVNLAFESEDIEIITADDGMTALEKIAEFSPDLVMADINMPGADGYQICERIKQDESTKHIPVLLLVGSFEPFSEEKAERVGAEGFLKKPFQSIGMLINRVTELLDMNKETESASSADDFSEADTKPLPAYESSETPESETVYSMNDNWNETEMDDEMIETERGADYSFGDETSKYETTTEIDVGAEAENVETVYELADEQGDYSSAAPFIPTETETGETSGESYTNRTDSYEDYSAYRQTEENVDSSESEASSVLELDDFQLLELPSLVPFDKTFSTDKPTDTDSASAVSQTQPAQAETDFSDYAETTAEDSYSMPQTTESTETEAAADFDSLENQPETIGIYYSPEPEFETDTEITKDFSDNEKEEVSVPQPEESAAEETKQEIEKSDADKLVVHYFPPEVIDEIAERVVAKLAEKLGK